MITTSNHMEIKTNLSTHCPVCQAETNSVIFQIADMPVVSNLLWERKADAISAPRGDISLSFCDTCGHVFNQAFKPEIIEYTAAYENSLSFSSVFQKYAEDIANHLVSKFKLYNRRIIEIGSGQGDFINALCDLGGNTGVGYDPSIDISKVKPKPGVTFIPEYYSPDRHHQPADFICSRHTLEHIYNPAGFLRSIRETIPPGQQTVLFFEVPNLDFIFRDTSIWDVIYEHYSYFSKNSLSYLFSNSGFDVIDVYETYQGQFLCIEAFIGLQADSHQLVTGQSSRMHADHFATMSSEKISGWREKVHEFALDGQTVLWGAGSKGISFLNMLKVAGEIRYVVDINPRKTGMHITGTGQEIVPPEFLKNFPPARVILMNPIYQAEVSSILATLGIESLVLVA